MEGTQRPVVSLRRADVITALLVVAALGYTGFALLRGSDAEPRRPAADHAAQVAQAATPSPTSPDAPASTSGLDEPDESGATGAIGTATAANPGGGPVADPGATSGNPTSGNPTSGGAIGGQATSAAASSASGLPTRTTTGRPAASPTVPGTERVTAPETPAVTRSAAPLQVTPLVVTSRTTAAAPAPAAAAAVAAVDPLPPGTLYSGSTISLRATTACCTNRYLRDLNGREITSVVTSFSSGSEKVDASWVVRPGLADSSCVSFESRSRAGTFLRHSNFQLYRQSFDGTALFRADATFCPRSGRSGIGTSFASYNFPTKFLRHFDNALFLAGNGGSNAWDNPSHWADDVSWVVGLPWAS